MCNRIPESSLTPYILKYDISVQFSVLETDQSYVYSFVHFLCLWIVTLIGSRPINLTFTLSSIHKSHNSSNIVAHSLVIKRQIPTQNGTANVTSIMLEI